jgi:hypothetical protein
VHPSKGGKLDSALDAQLTAHEDGAVRVIVQSAAAQDVKSRVKSRGGRLLKDHPSIQAFTAIVGIAELETLRADADVIHVSLDAITGLTHSNASDELAR